MFPVPMDAASAVLKAWNGVRGPPPGDEGASRVAAMRELDEAEAQRQEEPGSEKEGHRPGAPDGVARGEDRPRDASAHGLRGDAERVRGRGAHEGVGKESGINVAQ